MPLGIYANIRLEERRNIGKSRNEREEMQGCLEIW